MICNYLLIRVSVNCVIEKNGKFLLVKQARSEYVKGKWSLPGGKINQGEKFDDAVSREIEEETGLKVKKIWHIGIIQELPSRTVKHIFKVEAENNDIEFKFDKKEILDVRWFSLQKINLLKSQNKLRGNWVFKAIQITIKQK